MSNAHDPVRGPGSSGSRPGGPGDGKPEGESRPSGSQPSGSPLSESSLSGPPLSGPLSGPPLSGPDRPAPRSAFERVAEHLVAQRETGDSIALARGETNYDVRKVHEALDRIRRLVFDLSAPAHLASDLQVIHGLTAGLIGDTKAARLIDQLPDVRHCVAMDVQAAFDRDPAAKTYAEVIASYPSSTAVPTYRIAHAFYDLGEAVVARIMSEWAHSVTGIDIHPGAEIGCHFFIDHGTGVVIGETCEIGDRVKLYHGVTLGAFSNRRGRADAGRKRHPTIEDDVTIYPNATILGGDTVVGEGSVIGGNAWVTRSVPPMSRVMIEPPRLQVRKQADGPMLETDYEL